MDNANLANKIAIVIFLHLKMVYVHNLWNNVFNVYLIMIVQISYNVIWIKGNVRGVQEIVQFAILHSFLCVKQMKSVEHAKKINIAWTWKMSFNFVRKVEMRIMVMILVAILLRIFV